ncbi:MAG: hemin-degrading factor [Mesorhizobium sp.]|nr:ChuX/HutX family heme-like substrate-binding protein [Mesorhizobium sp.]MCO5163799.1 hemin-degrading factor [Mesorhizobium sp.]
MSAARPTPAAIRQARSDNPKIRERDLAAQLGISEAEFVAAWVGEGVRRIRPDVAAFLAGMEALGEVMALTRNESAVHEKIGVYDKVVFGEHAAMALGAQIDLRIFPKVWAHGYAVAKTDTDGAVRRSLQFFDDEGGAVHKVHLRPASNVEAYEDLVAALLHPDQKQELRVVAPVATIGSATKPAADVEELRARWSAMTDVHQFVSILRDLQLTRQQAVHLVGEDFAWPVDHDSVAAMMRISANEQIPIMCFVGNRGCIQIHSGPVKEIKPMGPWLNVLDETFHLHLRLDHIREVWAVRKPASEGHVTSLEAYGADGRLIIQFFGKRGEGSFERGDWRGLVENLPRGPRSTAA